MSGGLRWAGSDLRHRVQPRAVERARHDQHVDVRVLRVEALREHAAREVGRDELGSDGGPHGGEPLARELHDLGRGLDPDIALSVHGGDASPRREGGQASRARRGPGRTWGAPAAPEPRRRRAGADLRRPLDPRFSPRLRLPSRERRAPARGGPGSAEGHRRRRVARGPDHRRWPGRAHRRDVLPDAQALGAGGGRRPRGRTARLGLRGQAGARLAGPCAGRRQRPGRPAGHARARAGRRVRGVREGRGRPPPRGPLRGGHPRRADPRGARPPRGFGDHRDRRGRLRAAPPPGAGRGGVVGGLRHLPDARAREGGRAHGRGGGRWRLRARERAGRAPRRGERDDRPHARRLQGHGDQPRRRQPDAHPAPARHAG